MNRIRTWGTACINTWNGGTVQCIRGGRLKISVFTWCNGYTWIHKSYHSWSNCNLRATIQGDHRSQCEFVAFSQKNNRYIDVPSGVKNIAGNPHIIDSITAKIHDTTYVDRQAIEVYWNQYGTILLLLPLVYRFAQRINGEADKVGGKILQYYLWSEGTSRQLDNAF